MRSSTQTPQHSSLKFLRFHSRQKTMRYLEEIGHEVEKQVPQESQIRVFLFEGRINEWGQIEWRTVPTRRTESTAMEEQGVSNSASISISHPLLFCIRSLKIAIVNCRVDTHFLTVFCNKKQDDGLLNFQWHHSRPASCFYHVNF